jgi:hypothetical protein
MAEWRGGWRTKTDEDGHPIAGDGLAIDAVHAYAGPGTCAATLQIDDDAGVTSRATLSVPVSTPIAVLQAIVADLDCPVH